MAKIKGWSKFQHFKDRKPPWIKLYRDILDDIEWHKMPGDSAKTLVMLWLIASENDGNLPDIETLAFRLRSSVSDLEKQLKQLSHWVETERYQGDITTSQESSVSEVSDHQETETETEKEAPRNRVTPPEGVSLLVWADFLKVRKAKRAPMTDSALEGIRREVAKAGWSLEEALKECCARGWQSFKAEWVDGKPSESGGGIFAGAI